VVKLLALAYKDVVFDLYEGPNDSYCIDAASEYDDDAVRLFLSVDHLDFFDVSLSGKVIWDGASFKDKADPARWLVDQVSPYLNHGLSLVRVWPWLGVLSPTELVSNEMLVGRRVKTVKTWQSWTPKAS
jgi:predicted heme/steroid binding protein